MGLLSLYLKVDRNSFRAESYLTNSGQCFCLECGHVFWVFESVGRYVLVKRR